MKTFVIEVAPGVHTRIPGFYHQSGKFYLVTDEMEAAAGETLNLDRVIRVLSERTGIPAYRFERLATRSKKESV